MKTWETSHATNHRSAKKECPHFKMMINVSLLARMASSCTWCFCSAQLQGPCSGGRLAAWIMRASAATAPVDRMGLQCHVDDPRLVALGTKDGSYHRVRMCILVTWRILNCCLAWNEGALGQCVEWIGGSPRLNVGCSSENDDAVIVSIGESKLTKCRRSRLRWRKRAWWTEPG